MSLYTQLISTVKGEDFELVSPEVVQFPAGTSDNHTIQCLNISALRDNTLEGRQSFPVDISVSGINPPSIITLRSSQAPVYIEDIDSEFICIITFTW